MKTKKEPKQKKSLKRVIAEWIVQIAVLTAAVVGVSLWQTRNMVNSGAPAPSFALTDLHGNRVSLSDTEGKSVVLYFFAPWCSVCHAASHNINALRAAYDTEELTIYAVGLGWETTRALHEFAQKHDLNVPVLIGEEQTSADYRISSFPSVYILDDTHRISYRLVGYTTEWGLRVRTALTSIF